MIVTVCTIGMNILFYLLLIFFSDISSSGNKNLVFFILFQLLTFILLFLALRYLFESLVTRKIKVIYKVISDSKLGENKSKMIMHHDNSIDEVNDHVLQWAENTTKELSTLRTLEEYRKKYVGFISHELKTPIFSIQGYIHTLLEGGLYDENINLKYLNRAAKNIERIQNIVDDLELINKLEFGKIILEKTDFDIYKLVQEVFYDLEGAAKEKDIKLRLNIQENVPYQVHADRENIRQVLINLISNSIKYGKEGGHTNVGFYDMEENILVEVSDNGIGIDESHKKHIFDRFYRADHSRSRPQGGSGLGLSIVKHIIEAHHQTINVRSTLNVGSTFGFSLEKA